MPRFRAATLRAKLLRRKVIRFSRSGDRLLVVAGISLRARKQVLESLAGIGRRLVVLVRRAWIAGPETSRHRGDILHGLSGFAAIQLVARVTDAGVRPRRSEQLLENHRYRDDGEHDPHDAEA